MADTKSITYTWTVDTQGPDITITGNTIVNICIGDTYTDEGATATDNCDVNLPAITVTGLPINTNILGDHYVTYSVTDACGNYSQVIRTVKVHPTYFFSEDIYIYDYELPYTWHGNNYNASGTYYANYLTANGCDSIYELNLTVKPGKPLWVSKNVGRAVQASWLAIPGAEMYQLRYREKIVPPLPPDQGWTLVTQSTQLFRKIMPLIENTEYELQMRYKQNGIWNDWNTGYAPIEFNSGLVEFSTSYDIGTKLLVTWTSIDSVSSYILQYKKASETAWITKGYYPVGTTSAVMGTVEENTLYQYRICPRYNEVSFEWSHYDEIQSNYISITVSNYFGTSANFAWNAVSNPTATFYILQVRKVNDNVASNWLNFGTTSLNALIIGLIQGQNYEYRLTVRYGNPPVSWGSTSWRILQNNKETELVIEQSNVINVFPNPVDDEMNVEILSDEVSPYTLYLFDVNGKLLKNVAGELSPGINYIQIDVSQLPTGLYLLQSQYNGNTESVKILKQ